VSERCVTGRASERTDWQKATHGPLEACPLGTSSDIHGENTISRLLSERNHTPGRLSTLLGVRVTEDEVECPLTAIQYLYRELIPRTPRKEIGIYISLTSYFSLYWSAFPSVMLSSFETFPQIPATFRVFLSYFSASSHGTSFLNWGMLFVTMSSPLTLVHSILSTVICSLGSIRMRPTPEKSRISNGRITRAAKRANLTLRVSVNTTSTEVCLNQRPSNTLFSRSDSFEKR
jgi:hypothetical protein